MGCSPSKGQLFSKKALLSGLQESNAELLSDGTELQVKTEKNTASEGLAASEIQDNTINVQVKRSSLDDVGDATVIVKEDGSEEDAIPQRRASQDGKIAEEWNKQEGTEEINTKDKQGKRTKQRKQKLRKSSYVQSKAEFILKAHQAAYAYLNPRISKYESLLGLLDQAAQSRHSLQTAVASVVLHYEEINQALEEMATEGEQMLREHGHHMTWPASLKDYPPTTTIPSNGLNFSELPSELLQQMLLHSTVKMISVGDSVKCLGDSSLQELSDYFGSLSQLLGEKALAKHAAERRLKQVLAHVEVAALRKPYLEDSALHSEDSGLGADNECHNGTERLLRHRGSSGSGANAGTASVCTTSSSPDQQLLNGSEEVTDNDDNDDDKDEDDDDAEIEDEVSARNEHRRLTDKTRGAICASFEADSSHPQVDACLQKHDQAIGNLKMKIRRPKTADNTCQLKLKHRHLRGPNRSQSTECLHTKLEESVLNEQQRSLRDNKTPSWRAKNLPGELVLGGRVRTKIRRHLSGGQSAARYYGLQYGSKGPFKAMPPPSSPPSFTPEPLGRNAVKRLINTFSQGAEDNSSQSSSYHRPIKLRGNKKCSLPRLLNSRGALTTSTSINPLDPRPLERPEHLDIDSLPPPPPEMLMDNSYETSVGLPGVEGDNESQCRGQQCCTSMQRETVLPNKANMQRGSVSFSDTRPVRQDTSVGAYIKIDSEREVAVPLDHLRKAIHLPHSAESSAKTGVANGGTHRSSPHQGCENPFEGQAATPHPPTTPPVSRARLPPSCPTVYHAVPSPSSTACPPIGKRAPSKTPTTSCIQRWAMAKENIHSASSSQSFFEARAVFCQDNQSSNTWTPTCTSTLPRPWGEPAKGRLPTARLKQSFVRRSTSGHRSSHSEQPQSSPNAKQQDQGSDITALTSEG